jgi:arabinogalactan endo-1,4-beta-galactosidase
MRIYFTFLLLFLAFSIAAQTFYHGVDLSYVNELEDCDVTYFENGEPKDPYEIFANHGSNLARYRLWHNPEWTDYSVFQDVKNAISRAKAAGMDVLLDFHYSDTWADPGRQLRPAAWNEITDLEILGDSVYNYTLSTLEKLKAQSLVPEMVQIGNETNPNILLLEGEELWPLDWPRNIHLFNRGMDAVDDFNAAHGESVRTMIHIAQPENGEWWFADAAANGFTRFDIIGLSYYPAWSEYGIRKTADVIAQMVETYNKDVMIVETAYPWTFDNNDDAGNILFTDALLNTHSDQPSQEEQANFMRELTWLVMQAGGSGVIYWEPAWVSSSCSTQWGQGSHWENATLFDFDNNLHTGASYLDYDYTQMPESLKGHEAIFRVDATGVDVSNGVFVTGDFTGEAWQFIPMAATGDNIFEASYNIPGRSDGAYIFQNDDDWDAQWREPVPEDCALWWDTHREFLVKNEAAEFPFIWGSCTKIGEVGFDEIPGFEISISPNPVSDVLNVKSEKRITHFRILSIDGSVTQDSTNTEKRNFRIDVSNLPANTYLLELKIKEGEVIVWKFLKR